MSESGISNMFGMSFRTKAARLRTGRSFMPHKVTCFGMSLQRAHGRTLLLNASNPKPKSRPRPNRGRPTSPTPATVHRVRPYR
jgi:hypothetical protein